MCCVCSIYTGERKNREVERMSDHIHLHLVVASIHCKKKTLLYTVNECAIIHTQHTPPKSVLFFNFSTCFFACSMLLWTLWLSYFQSNSCWPKCSITCVYCVFFSFSIHIFEYDYSYIHIWYAAVYRKFSNYSLLIYSVSYLIRLNKHH